MHRLHLVQAVPCDKILSRTGSEVKKKRGNLRSVFLPHTENAHHSVPVDHSIAAISERRFGLQASAASLPNSFLVTWTGSSMDQQYAH